MVASSSRRDDLNCLHFPQWPQDGKVDGVSEQNPPQLRRTGDTENSSSSSGNFQNRYSPKWMFRKLSGGSVVKNLPANAGDTGSVPELGRSTGERNGNPLQNSHLENPMDRGAGSGLPFPPLVDHVLSELFTMTCPTWVTLHGMAHSFIELYKPLCHEKAVVHIQLRLLQFY